MEILFSFPRLDDLLFIEEILRNDDILLDALDIEGNHQYQLINYHLHDSKKFSCLLDRNIVTDLVSLIRGKQVPEDSSGKSLRIVAGLQAFLNAAEILSEPSIAYHEYMDTVDLVTADTELALFRSADNLNANIFLDIALGLRTSVPQDVVPHFSSGELKNKNIPEKLKYFERNIITIKKALIVKASSVS
ncbi:MAG: hypothetical protein H0X02_03915, partial [Nitrosomonas sp.]|nr:hypothetical protein [Nitrosomonas sp.]